MKISQLVIELQQGLKCPYVVILVKTITDKRSIRNSNVTLFRFYFVGEKIVVKSPYPGVTRLQKRVDFENSLVNFPNASLSVN